MSIKKLTATKEYVWDMAHMLAGHRGLCKNLHGHTYKMLVTISREDVTSASGADEGMVMDFKDLKEIVTEVIVDKFDHAVVLNLNTTDEFEKGLISLVKGFNKKAVFVDYRTTAENMAADFFKRIEDGFKCRSARQYTLESVRLYETPTSYAEYTRIG